MSAAITTQFISVNHLCQIPAITHHKDHCRQQPGDWFRTDTQVGLQWTYNTIVANDRSWPKTFYSPQFIMLFIIIIMRNLRRIYDGRWPDIHGFASSHQLLWQIFLRPNVFRTNAQSHAGTHTHTCTVHKDSKPAACLLLYKHKKLKTPHLIWSRPGGKCLSTPIHHPDQARDRTEDHGLMASSSNVSPLLQNVQTGSGCQGLFPLQLCGRGVKLAIQIHTIYLEVTNEWSYTCNPPPLPPNSVT